MSAKKEAVLSVLGIETDVESLDIQGVFKNLARIKALMEILNEHEKSLRDKAFRLAEERGEMDEKGSMIVRLPDGNWFKKEARTSVEVNREEAVELFKRKNLVHRLKPDLSTIDSREVYAILKKVKPDLVKDITYTVDDIEIEQAFYNGEITEQELENIIKKKVSYALKLSKKK